MIKNYIAAMILLNLSVLFLGFYSCEKNNEVELIKGGVYEKDY
jgi:hypothetical protein